MVKNGWLPSGTTGLWEINSIGEVVHDGQRMLIAALSEGNATEDSGISLVQAIAGRRPAPWPRARADGPHPRWVMCDPRQHRRIRAIGKHIGEVGRGRSANCRVSVRWWVSGSDRADR